MAEDAEHVLLNLMTLIHFPPLVSDLPLAAYGAWPENTVALFMNDIRVAIDIGYGIEPSIVALAITFFLYARFECLKKSNYMHKKSLVILSLFFGVVNVLGLCMYWLDCLPMFSSVAWLVGCILLALGWAGIFIIVADFIFFILDKRILARNINNVCYINLGWMEKHLLGCSFGIIFLAWLPWIISYFPASMDNDVFDQLYSWLCVPSNHHPWFSSCVLGICYNIGANIGSDNLGIFIYVIGRNIVLSLIYAECVVLQRKTGYKKCVYYATLLFYAITPVWGAYAKHAFKDTFCAGLFCLYIVTLIIIIQQVKKNTLTTQVCLIHGIALLAVSLFRNNCIYAILPTTLILAIVLIRKRQVIWKIALILCCLFIYFGYNYYIINYANVLPGSQVEALSIPFQQTARTVKYHSDDLTIEERRVIDDIFQYEGLAEAYDPILSDSIKWRATEKWNEYNGVAGTYFKIWLQMLIRHPVTYLEAAVGQSYGYYSFTPNLPERSGNWNSGMTIFDSITIDREFDDNFQFHYVEKMGDLRQILHMWAKIWDRIPVICFSDICAAYTWGIVILFYYLLIKKKLLNLIPLLAVGIMILTCMASPVNDCFRYYAPIAASFPALLVLLQNDENM